MFTALKELTRVAPLERGDFPSRIGHDPRIAGSICAVRSGHSFEATKGIWKNKNPPGARESEVGYFSFPCGGWSLGQLSLE
jgi:hypothetical protein